MNFLSIFQKKWPLLLASLGWVYYFLILFVFYNYITVLMLSGLTVFLPSIILTLRIHDKKRRLHILKRKLIASGIMLGCFALLLFPNLLRIPTNIHRRFDRSNTLITPQNQAVIDMKEEYLSGLENGEMSGIEVFENMSLQERFDNLTEYIKAKIEWTPDLETQLLAGDVCTPEEAIRSGKDDCRGHAVVTVSILINMGYDANVVEIPWHWYTIVYKNGEEYRLNYEPERHNYPILMIFNDESARYNRDPIGQYISTMNTHERFYIFFNQLGLLVFLIAFLLGLVVSAYTDVASGQFHSILQRRKGIVKKFLVRTILGFFMFSGMMFALIFLSLSPMNGLGGIYVFVYSISAIFTIISSEFFNNKLLNSLNQ
jgi:hypothetical protein